MRYRVSFLRQYCGLRGWITIAAVFGLAAVLAAANARMQRTTDWGFYPADAQWVIAVEDFPLFWSAASNVPAMQAVKTNLPQWVHQAELSIRLATGIRPTPARWRAWLGPRLLISGRDGQWGGCLHPGILARGADLLNGLAGGGQNETGLRKFGNWYYAWRNGFLLISKWPEYVQRTLEGTAVKVPATPETDSAILWWQGDHAGHCILRVADGFPISGTLRSEFQPCEKPIIAPDSWPGKPLIAISGCNPGDMWKNGGDAMAFLAQYPEIVAFQRIYRLFYERWGLGKVWNELQNFHGGVSLAWTGLDTSETVPVPIGALLLAENGQPLTRHPGWSFMQASRPLEFQWDDRPGWVAPVLGEKFSICLSDKDGWWVMATQESEMDRLMADLHPGFLPGADMALRVDWKAISDVALRLLHIAAELELIPEMNLRDVDTNLVPITTVMAQWGTLFVAGEARDDTIEFAGHLTRSEGSAQ